MTMIRPALKRLLLDTGYYARRLRNTRLPGVAVLGFHGLRAPGQAMEFQNLHVSVDRFEQHCRLIRDACDPIALDDWREVRAGRAKLPRRPVLVTFDDGYRSVLTLAAPILRQFGVPAVAFVCSAPAEAGSRLWFDAVARAAGEDAVEPLKTAPPRALADRLATVDMSSADCDPHALLSPVEVKELAAIPAIEIGAHSATHRILATVPREEQARELATSKMAIEGWIGRPVRALAYPNGRPGVDYTPETVELAREAGYDVAFSTRSAYAHESDPILELPRFTILDAVSTAELAHRLCYSWS